MFLSRPDRSIPPYSIGAQQGTIVAVHVPSWTSDPEIQALLYRFRSVGKETGNFGTMKIQPTTPAHPGSRYREMTMYVFANYEWATPEILARYLALPAHPTPEDRQFQREFESEVRGGFIFTETEIQGWLGPLGWEHTVMPEFAHHVLFEETRLSAGAPHSSDSES